MYAFVQIVVHITDAVLLPQIIYADDKKFILQDAEGNQETFAIDTNAAPPMSLSAGLSSAASPGTVMTFSIG